jgi:hypothetical protein
MKVCKVEPRKMELLADSIQVVSQLERSEVEPMSEVAGLKMELVEVETLADLEMVWESWNRHFQLENLYSNLAEVDKGYTESVVVVVVVVVAVIVVQQHCCMAT